MVTKNEATVETWEKCWRIRWNIGVTPTRLNIFRLFRKLGLTYEDKVLDAGCGSGTLAYYWHKQGYDVKAVDFSDNALEIAGKKGLKCTMADILQGLPFDDNSFSLVYSDGLLEHFYNPNEVLEELWRVSNKYLLTLVPRDDWYNAICRKIFNIPEEYLHSDKEWMGTHLGLKPAGIEVRKVKFGILWVLCEK